jgi:hypothetical protein
LLFELRWDVVNIYVNNGVLLFHKLLRIKIILLCFWMLSTNSTTSIFRAAEHVFYASVANGLGMIKNPTVGVNSGRLIQLQHKSVLLSSVPIAISPSSCEVLGKENTVNSE